MTDLDSIKKTLVGISKGDGILEMLMEFERTLDNSQIFAYKNWLSGELVEGPDISRYWFTTTWMYPASMMPDPDGGLRLTKLGAKVSYKKGKFHRPVKVHGPEDWADPQTKQAKMSEHDIWLVTIEMPMKYINRGLEIGDKVMQKDIQNASEEIADAFEEQELDNQPVELENSAEQGTGDIPGEQP